MKQEYKGLLAEVCMKKNRDKDDDKFIACGHFIEDLDYFEQTRQNLIRDFRQVTIDDDIYALHHRDELI